jgi:Xaa-Pro aminopeptidase
MTGNSPEQRRENLASRLARKKIDLAIISNPLHVQYFTGFGTNRLRFTSLLLVDQGGESSVVAGESEARSLENVFNGRAILFTDYDIGQRMIAYPDFVTKQLATGIQKAIKTVGTRVRRIGIEDWYLPQIHAQTISRLLPDAAFVALSSLILRMRQRKGADEIESLSKASKRLDHAYSVASRNMTKGLGELELYSIVNSEFSRRYGPFSRALGDYVSGSRTLEMGGSPAEKKLRNGETVILDLQTVFEGYWADTARTFVVGNPSRAQQAAASVVLRAKRKAEELLRPGTKAKEIYNTVSQEISKSGLGGELPHHAGHGLGLEDQEPPFLLPNSEETLQEGMVLAVEPGLYSKASGGIRIEDNYLIRADGYTKLSKYPLGWR